MWKTSLIPTYSTSIRLVTKASGLLLYVASILTQLFIAELRSAALPRLRGRVTSHRKIFLFFVLWKGGGKKRIRKFSDSSQKNPRWWFWGKPTCTMTTKEHKHFLHYNLKGFANCRWQSSSLFLFVWLALVFKWTEEKICLLLNWLSTITPNLVLVKLFPIQLLINYSFLVSHHKTQESHKYIQISMVLHIYIRQCIRNRLNQTHWAPVSLQTFKAKING